MVKENKFFRIIVPMMLLLYPFIKVMLGVDYMDSMYSPGNFVFFSRMEGMWVVATFLSNVIGFFLIQLPGADTYLGLRIYTNLFISALALISYFWLKRRIPAWIVAIGEVIAIGFCWCPTTILYNYLTYLFMLLGIVFLYEGLVKQKKIYLVIAGMLLGLNLFVRFPNLVEAGFILAVWIYGFWKKKKIVQVVKETLLCMAGYLSSVFIVICVITILYGADSYIQMIQSLFSMTDSASSYKPMEMILAIVREYKKGLKWPIGMALYATAMGGMFKMLKQWLPNLYNRYQWVARMVSILGIVVLFRWYYGQGMFNVNYHTYPSIFQWGVCFLIVTIVISVSILFEKLETEDFERKLAYLLILLIILITPIGSNNNLFSIMNNLFLIAPLTIYALYDFAKDRLSSTYMFPSRAMIAAMVIAVFIQSIGFGITFSFRGAREGEKRDTKIENNDILKGMITNFEKAQAIEELTLYWEEQHGMNPEEVILFGHIPGVSYFLDVPCAISTSWPDLASYSSVNFEKELKELESEIQNKERKSPTVIVSYGVHAVLTNDATAMAWYADNMESGEDDLEIMQKSKKVERLERFLMENEYRREFGNQRFVIYESLKERTN